MGYQFSSDDIMVDNPRTCRRSIHRALRAHVAGFEGLDAVEVVECLDRTFLMHKGGKIEVLARLPLRERDDLSMAYTPGVARVCMAITAPFDHWTSPGDVQ